MIMRFFSHTRIGRIWMARFKRLRRDQRGIAAVEFAFVLPVMLTFYLGTVEITQGVTANRQATAVSRALSDLAAQQLGAITDQSGGTGTQVSTIFAAAQALFPQSTTANPIRMALSGVSFVQTNPLCPVICSYDAYTSWSVTQSGGTTRPCQKLTPVANDASPSSTTMPTGLYGAGSVIVADVSYAYKPTFGYVLINDIPISHTTYMRPRTQTYITFNAATSSEKCSGIP